MRRVVTFLWLLVIGPAGAVSPQTWDEACYAGVGAQVASLIGKEGIDCGLVRIGAPEEDFNSVILCAKDALARHAPVRFGYEGYGDDSDFCDIAAVTPDGEIISVWIDQDVRGGGKRDGSNRVVGISRCKEIAFRPGTIYPHSFFAKEGCERAPDLDMEWSPQ